MTANTETVMALYQSVRSRMTGNPQDSKRLLDALITGATELTAQRVRQVVELARLLGGASDELARKPTRGRRGAEHELPALKDLSDLRGFEPALIVRIEEIKQRRRVRSTRQALLILAEEALRRDGKSSLRHRHAVESWAKTWANNVSKFKSARRQALKLWSGVEPNL